MDNCPSWGKVVPVGDTCFDSKGDSRQVCEDRLKVNQVVSFRSRGEACIVCVSAARSATHICWRWDHVDRVREARSVESCFRLSWKRHRDGSSCVNKEWLLGKSICRPNRIRGDDGYRYRWSRDFFWNWSVEVSVAVWEAHCHSVRAYDRRYKLCWVKAICWVSWRCCTWSRSSVRQWVDISCLIESDSRAINTLYCESGCSP